MFFYSSGKINPRIFSGFSVCFSSYSIIVRIVRDIEFKLGNGGTTETSAVEIVRREVPIVPIPSRQFRV